MSARPLLEVRGLRVEVGGLVAVADVDFSLTAGQSKALSDSRRCCPLSRAR